MQWRSWGHVILGRILPSNQITSTELGSDLIGWLKAVNLIFDQLID